MLDLLREEHDAGDWVKDGEMADALLRTEACDLLLLDLGLPRHDGRSILQTSRSRKNCIPVPIAVRDSRSPSWCSTR